jgi:hypothetical protein
MIKSEMSLVFDVFVATREMLQLFALAHYASAKIAVCVGSLEKR